jgi:hypothetical protein
MVRKKSIIGILMTSIAVLFHLKEERNRNRERKRVTKKEPEREGK